LQGGLAGIGKDLNELKNLLSAKAASAPSINVTGLELNLQNYPIRGSNSSRVVLLEITDYQCPYCSRYNRETYPEIMKQYVEKGSLLYTTVDNPLPSHKMAAQAAQAAHCAEEQGKFWEMHDIMMLKQESLGNISSLAGSINLNMVQFEECLKSNKYSDMIAKEIAWVSKIGITGVPGFILASVNKQDPTKARGIAFLRGAQPFDNFKKAIDLALDDGSFK
jgi:protein-disulfide isomerase